MQKKNKKKMKVSDSLLVADITLGDDDRYADTIGNKRQRKQSRTFIKCQEAQQNKQE